MCLCKFSSYLEVSRLSQNMYIVHINCNVIKRSVKAHIRIFYYSKIGWRLGLQAVTGVIFLTFILGTFYRSASLYHPQRRAILHLKNQKRKIKDKNKAADRPPFFDFSTLKSKTVRILLVSTGISAFGINTPIFYLVTITNEFESTL